MVWAVISLITADSCSLPMPITPATVVLEAVAPVEVSEVLTV